MTWSAAALQTVRLCLIAGGMVVAGVLALKIAIPFLEPSLLFHPVRRYAATPAALGLPFEDVALTTGDGVRLHAWLVPGEGKSSLTLLFFHGNAENIGGCLDLAMLTRPAGYDLLLVDYRGYGESAGRPTEPGLSQDGRAALSYLISRRRPDAGQIVVWGRSIGAAVAVEVAAADPGAAAGVILESPFTSIPDLLRSGGHPLLYAASRFGSSRFDSASRIARVGAPLLFVHGTEDEVAPFELGQKLFDLAPGRKTFAAIDGGGHNNLWTRHETEVWGAVRRFLSSLD